MKILWFANTPCGSTEKLTGKPVVGGGWLYALSEELVKFKEIELHIAFYWGQDIKTFLWNGIYYHPVLMEGEGSRFGRLINRLITARSSNLDLKALPRLQDVIGCVAPDIIHIHGSEENFGMVASENLPCPVVMSIQGILAPCFCMFYRGFTKQEIKRGEGMLTKLLMSGITLKEKSFCRRSVREREFFKTIPNIVGRTFWDKACSLAMNPNRKYFEVGEILRPEFYKAEWNKKEFSNPFVITTTISSGYYKGLETVYQTAQILKNVGFSFQWNVIGLQAGDPLVRLSEKKVGERAELLNINLLGRKCAAEMVEIMVGADLYVQVSHIENSPNSLCEAMLLGMPIISTFAGGTASMLENNVEGRLLQDGEPYSMAGMIMEMADDFEHAKQMGQRAAETARKRHNSKYVCEQLIIVYRDIINRVE